MSKSGNDSEALLNGFNHQVAHHLTGNTPSGDNMTDDFAITAIQCESNAHHLPIPAGNLKAIRTPAQVGTQGSYLAFMSELRSFASIPGQQQAF